MATPIVRVHMALCLVALILANIFLVDASVGAKHKVSHRDGKKGASSKGLRSTVQNLRRSMREAVDEVLGAGHGFDNELLDKIRLDLEPIWASLAKNSQGRVERRLLNYVVQRFFLRKYGVSIVGLEPIHASSNSTEAALLSDFAPNYVRKVLEGDSAQRLFFMEDAVAMIAALMQLIQHSSGRVLEESYRAKGEDIRRSLDKDALGKVMEAFMLRWMLGEDQESIQLLEENETLKEISFEDWPHISHFTQGRVTSYQHQQSNQRGSGRTQVSTWNSFRPRFSYADAEAIVGGMALSFGSYWATECEVTMESLRRMDYTGSGRVKLSDFHGAALNGEWRFSESKEYLRQLGALDETSVWRGPRVIITNYVQSPSNCIISAEHYRVCCMNECEYHLSELEAEIRAPVATPEAILPTIERLHSGFDDNEPKLTPALKSQLKEIARANSGVVPIHGRLFAQWLHYVFPQDCPFPNKQNTTTTLSPLAFGNDYMATEEEMAENKETESNDADAAASQDEWKNNWSHEEELLSEHLHAPWEADFSTSALAFMIIAGICMLLLKSGIISFGNGKDVLPTRMKSHYV